MAEQTLLLRFRTLFTFFLTFSTFLSIGLNLNPSLVFVTAGLSEPSEWPHFFRSLKPIPFATLGGQPIPCLAPFSAAEQYIDSRTWQHMLRRVSLICLSTADLYTYNHPTQHFTSHGKYFAHKVFHLISGTKASFYVQICVPFLLSGLIHTCSRLDGGPLYFFLLQAISIIFEDVVFSCVKRAGLEHRLRVFTWLGYGWVWCWMLFSLPFYWVCIPHTGIVLNPARNIIFLSRHPVWMDFFGLV